MKIVVLDGFTSNPGDLSWQRLAALGELVVYPRTPEDAVVAHIGDAEIVITNKVVIDEAVMAATPNLKYIGVLATGYNIVDIAAARRRNIVVTNVPDYSADAVAEMVFAYLLKIYHDVALHSASVKAGEWTNCSDFCYWKSPLFELAGKTLGVVGYGKIAKRVVEIGKAFKMNILVYHHRTPAGNRKDGVQFVGFTELLERADIISLHVPLFDSTRQLINRAAIDKMKDGVILINTARGPLLDEAAVSAALASGKIAHLAVDVVSEEPIVQTNPLLSAANTLITPHIAWAPLEARMRLIDVAADNIAAFINGDVINGVN